MLTIVVVLVVLVVGPALAVLASRWGRSIALGRARLAAEALELDRWESELIAAAEGRSCAGCELWRRRALHE